MPLRRHVLRTLNLFVLGCVAWASGDIAGQSCLADGQHNQEECGAIEAEEQECVSQLQTAAVWPKHCKSCQAMAKDVTKTCNASSIWKCIGRIDNEGSVETKLPHTCAKSVAKHNPGVHVYKVYNDYDTDHAFKGEDFCLGPQMVDFDYAMSCFGESHGKCVEQGCMTCKEGEVSPAGETCDFKPGETKYMTVWFKRKPCCSKLAPEVTKECDISNLMTCMGKIDNTDPVETELDDSCARTARIRNPGAKVYKVHNDLHSAQSLRGEDFCFGKPEVSFNYAMSCFGNDKHGSCENQGCISCKRGEVSPKGETCDFMPGETKYMTVWFKTEPAPWGSKHTSGS